MMRIWNTLSVSRRKAPTENAKAPEKAIKKGAGSFDNTIPIPNPMEEPSLIPKRIEGGFFMRKRGERAKSRIFCEKILKNILFFVSRETLALFLSKQLCYNDKKGTKFAQFLDFRRHVKQSGDREGAL